MDRLRALEEVRRIAQPSGPVFVAAISRRAPRLDGELRGRLYQRFPGIRKETVRVERGLLPPAPAIAR